MEPSSPDPKILEEIQQRVLWLATRIVDAANHERDTGDGVKVGGHQASSASLVSVMTALYFAHLDAADRVSVKPHASPVYHAIQYLLGNLDRSYLPTLRAFGGLQSYPSRTKDPDGVDFSTGSVGLGAAAPLFAAATRRYVDAHFGARPRSRFIALIGDAELDEGNIWEAVADPATDGPGQRAVDRGRQPAVAGPGRARRPDRPVGAAVQRRRLARRRGQVRAASCRPRSASLAAGACATGSTRCPTSSTSRCSACEPAAVAGAVLRRRAAGRDRVLRGHARRRAGHAGHRPGRARPGHAAGCVRRLRRREGPAERGVRLHDQGLGPADRRQPAQSLGAADHPSRSTSCASGSG